jgi:hypothetical protein
MTGMSLPGENRSFLVALRWHFSLARYGNETSRFLTSPAGCKKLRDATRHGVLEDRSPRPCQPEGPVNGERGCWQSQQAAPWPRA